MRALIDGDNVAIACAWSTENEDVGICYARIDAMLDGILVDTKSTEYEVWLSGSSNFRYNIYPEYKGNRINMPRPKWEHEAKQHLKDKWQASVSVGCEADDMLGVRQYELTNSIICHLDKDMNQIRGQHFNWELWRLGKVIREKQLYTITHEEGDYWFFYQLLVGDSTDNIKGIDGIGPKKAAGILHGCESNQERYEAVLERYSCEEELDMNAQCVYIWRKNNDNWKSILDSPISIK